jgi:small redox-active disulfide protein 2
MLLQILGPGCRRCTALAVAVESVVSELGLEARVEKVQDPREIVRFGVLGTPALAVDGDVKIAGRVPSVDELRSLLRS